MYIFICCLLMVIGQIYHIYNSLNKINQYNGYVEHEVIHLSSEIFPFVHFHICYLLVFDTVPGTKQLLFFFFVLMRILNQMRMFD